MAPVLGTKKDVSFSWLPGNHCDIVFLIFKITFWLNARHLPIVIKCLKHRNKSMLTDTRGTKHDLAACWLLILKLAENS